MSSALIYALISFVISVASLIGWAFGLPILTDWSVVLHPFWPLTGFAFICVSLALVCATQSKYTAANLLSWPAVAIAGAALLEFASGAVGIDGLLFPDAVGQIPVLSPGRPRFAAACVLLLLSLALVRAPHRSKGSDLIVLATTGAVVGISSMSAVFMLLDRELAIFSVSLTTSLPAATIGILLSLGVAALPSPMSDYGEEEARGGHRADQWFIAFLGLPALQLYAQYQLVEVGIMTPLAASAASTTASIILVMGLMLGWNSRMQREQEALRSSELRLATAADAHCLGIFQWDLLNDQISWSPGAEQRMGLKPGSISSYEHWRELVVPEDVDSISKSIEAAVARKADRFSFQYHFKEPNGAVRAVEGSARCIYNAKGELIGTIGVNVDVTDRKDREADLAAREAQLRSILETVPDAMIIIDERGTILDFSAAAERMFGYGAADMIGRNVSILTPPDIEMRHDGYLSRYLDTGQRHVIGRVRHLAARRKDGSQIPIELNVGEAVIGGQRLFTGFIRDISTRLEAEERLSDLRNEYAHMARFTAMGEMASNLAHELNQPLAATANYLAATTGLLDQGADPARAAEMADLARQQVHRAGEIIRRLREFIARKDVEVAIEPIEKTVREAVALVLVGKAKQEVEISYDFGAEVHSMLADRVQIQQVLVNLLKNAVEAMSDLPAPKRRILVSATIADDDMVEISVADSGPGLPEKLIRGIYEPFSSTKGENGLGIGLSICRRIIEAHGGELKAENRPEGGAVFRFFIPCDEPREAL